MTAARAARRDSSLGLLLVEDNLPEAKLLVSLLGETARGRRLQADLAGSLEDARRAVSVRDYDLVVLDLGLPDANDDAVLAAVPELCAGGRALVVVTGREDDAVAAAALANGAEDYLVKGSFDPDLLGRCFLNAVERARRRERERGMLARMVRLEHLAVLGTTAGAIAHEVNNPLSYALLALEQAALLSPLADRRGNAPVADALDKVRTAIDGVDRAATTVRELSSHARPEARVARTTVRDEARWALDLARKKLDPAIAVRVEIRSTAPVEFRTGGLARVVLNLLLNARHAFRSPVPADARVEVAAHDGPGEVRLVISDNGRGMEPGQLRRAFEPFHTAVPDEGTGLGLFVVRTLVEEACGEVGIESAPGRGTRVTVRLPVAP